MKIIKTFPPADFLKIYTLDHNDKTYFTELGVSSDNLNVLIDYLMEEDKTIRIDESYDSQSHYKGFHFWIDEEDLSVNGFCFSNEKLKEFLDKIK